MRTYVIEETVGGWLLKASDDQENIWPDTNKNSARKIVSRLMQLMETGPLAPQIEPEEVCIDEVFTDEA